MASWRERGKRSGSNIAWMAIPSTSATSSSAIRSKSKP